MKSNTYKDLIVWQKACDLAVEVYSVTERLPSEEKFGLRSQMQRAAVSIASNIAEGSKRGTNKDFAQFIKIALGSTAELETQALILSRLSYSKNINLDKIEALSLEITKMLHSLTKSLSGN
ncbi:MAG: hypothetical protein RIQ41_454 [Candidatus Parcubacteria bacterium]|jgi:four helix bundle protein